MEPEPQPPLPVRGPVESRDVPRSNPRVPPPSRGAPRGASRAGVVLRDQLPRGPSREARPAWSCGRAEGGRGAVSPRFQAPLSTGLSRSLARPPRLRSSQALSRGRPPESGERLAWPPVHPPVWRGPRLCPAGPRPGPLRGGPREAKRGAPRGLRRGLGLRARMRAKSASTRWANSARKSFLVNASARAATEAASANARAIAPRSCGAA